MLERSKSQNNSEDEESYEQSMQIGKDKPMPRTPGDKKEYEVALMGPDDPMAALNWNYKEKGTVLVVISFVIMVAAWGSAIGAPATPVFMEMYHIGLPVATLTVSLYVLGFALGPIAWGPMSAANGRKMPLVISSFGLTVFFFGAAVAKDYQTLVICRFFQGVFGAGSLTVGPAIAGDTFKSHTRGSALTAVSLCIVAGPLVAPIVGGYIVQSFLGWRWTQYISGIMSGFGLVLLVLLVPETDTKALLRKKAAHLRNTTGNWALRGPDEGKEFKWREFVDGVLLGPILMLSREAILALVTIYHGFIYGILYMCLEAVPIIFTGFNFKGAIVYLPYISILTGAILVCVVNIAIFEPWYNRELEKRNSPVLPENRLPLMVLSGGTFTGGIFWMCWAGAYPQHVHWIVPMIGMGFVGFGMIGIFLACFNYILDTYLMLSAQAFAANTFFRSAFGCAFPLFVHPMFINLGIQWAGTLIGCLAALLFPVPILFYIYGARLRSISPYALNLDDNKKSAENETALDTNNEENKNKPEEA